MSKLLMMKRSNYLAPRVDIVLLQLEQSITTASTLSLLDSIDAPDVLEDTSGTSFIDY